jgi:cytochrome c oxidase subunit I+III
LAALLTAAFFFGLTLKLYIPAFACGALAIACVLWWLWDTDPGPDVPAVDIGGGLVLPAYVTGSVSHSWWAMIVLIMVAATAFACLLFSYFFLWTVNPQLWPREPAGLPHLAWPVASAALYLLSGAGVFAAGRLLARMPGRSSFPIILALVAATLLIPLPVAVEVLSQRSIGLSPSATSYGAVVYTVAAWQGFFAAVLVLMGVYTAARSLTGRLSAERRVTFDNTQLLWQYTIVQGIVSLAIVHLFPRLLG